MVLYIFLVDTALELIPPKFQSHPSVITNLKKYGNAGRLLDTTLHHSFLSKIPNGEKRGRPDILFHFLLDTLGSIANLRKFLRIFFQISIPSSHLYEVQSGMNCPRDYIRFKGLMFQLLSLGHIPPESPFFISELDMNLNGWLKKNLNSPQILKFTRKGNFIPIKKIFEPYKLDQDLVIFLGGFQKGFYSEEINQISSLEYAIYSEGLDSWIVLNRILSAYELQYNLL